MAVTNNHKAAHDIFSQLQTSSQANLAGSIALVSSAHSGSGTSFIARSIAIAAAEHYAPLGQRVLLLDYDIHKQCQLQNIMTTSQLYGPYDASFGVTPFWQVRAGITQDSPELPADAYASLYIDAQTGLAVSVFRWDQIGANQSVSLVPSPDYWTTLRQHFAMIVIDGPAIDRTNMSMTLYPHVDNVCIVANAQNSSSPQTLQMAQDIQKFGSHCSGLILNNVAHGSV